MAAQIDENIQYTDPSTGELLNNGYIYIGADGLDAKLNAQTIYADRELTVPLSNPQRIGSDGRALNKIWVSGKYSMKVENYENVQKLNDLSLGEITPIGNTVLGSVTGINAVVADASPTLTALVNGQTYIFTAASTNTGPMTLTIGLTSTYSIKKYHDGDMQAGDIEANQVVSVIWNATDSVFELISASSRSSLYPTTKAEAAGLTYTAADAGRVIHITSDDGGKFVVKYNATLGTYADNGGSYCGTQFIPTGGDGTIGLVRDYSGAVNVKWFGAKIDGLTDDAAEIQAAIVAVYNDGGGDVEIPNGVVIVGSTIDMYRGVRLTAPGQQPGIPQFYLPTSEAVIQGVTRIKADTGMTTDIILFDFNRATRLERPHGSGLSGAFVIDGTNQTAGNGIRFATPPSGGGAFGNGEASDVATLKNVSVTRCAENGIYQEDDINTVKYLNVKSSFNGECGFRIDNCNDTKIVRGASFENAIGVWLNGSTTATIRHFDSFNNRYNAAVANSGTALLDDSIYLNAYDSFFQNSERHAVRMIGVQQATTNKNSVYSMCRITGGSGEANNTYSNMSIGAVSTVGIGGFKLIGCEFSTLDNSESPTNKAKNGLELDAITDTAILAEGCVFAQLNVNTTGNQLNSNAKKCISFSACTQGGYEILGNEATVLPDSGGGAWQPNVLLGPGFFQTNNSVATTLDGFTGSTVGREITVRIADANTTLDFTSSNLIGNGGVDYAAPLGTVIQAFCVDGTKWAVTSITP